MNALFENGIDSLRVGMNFFAEQKSKTSNKHAILLVFHCIELLLKEYLFRINPILIYKNIDKKILDDSFTVGIKDILIRFENLGVKIEKEEKKIIEKLQRRRNRIEHHRYDIDDEDEIILGESLKLINYFVKFKLNDDIKNHIDAELVHRINQLIYAYEELKGLAESELYEWLMENYPGFDPRKEDTPDDFPGTVECPKCSTELLVMDIFAIPYCFYCKDNIDAHECENCGSIVMKESECSCCYY